MTESLTSNFQDTNKLPTTKEIHDAIQDANLFARQDHKCAANALRPVIEALFEPENWGGSYTSRNEKMLLVNAITKFQSLAEPDDPLNTKICSRLEQNARIEQRRHSSRPRDERDMSASAVNVLATHPNFAAEH